MTSAQMTVDQVVCETLSQYGVEYVFGMKIYTDLDVSRTRPIGIHYETSAELMAYGYARVSGKPGVAAINRPGTEAPWNIGEFYGQSYFCDPRGQIVAEGCRARDDIVVADMDFDLIREVRNTWQFFRDRRPETYGAIVQL